MDNYGHGVHEESLEELSTSALVKELYVHGRSLLEVEARSLKEQLAREVTRTGGDLRVQGKTALAQAKDRLHRHVEALKEDLREKGRQAGAAAKPIAIGGVLAHAAVFLLLAGLVLVLDHVMPLWLAALLVGVLAGGAGWLMVRRGAAQIKEAGKHAFQRFNDEKTETRRWMDSTGRTVSEKVHDVRSALSGIEWPKLPASSGGAPSPTT